MAKPKKVKSVCVPLDPDECGSTISGVVRFPEIERNNYGKKRHFVRCGASVSLSDCSRVVTWSLTDIHRFDIEKIDRAIGALTRLREYLVEAEARRLVLDTEVKTKNDELGEDE